MNQDQTNQIRLIGPQPLDLQPQKAVIDHHIIHQSIIDIGDLQAELDSLKITLFQLLRHLRQQGVQTHV